MAATKDDKQFKYDAGNTLLELREKAGMTQPELAEKINVEPNSVHRYEKGERQMNLHTAYEASVALGVPMEDLIPDSYKKDKPKTEAVSQKKETPTNLAEAIAKLALLNPQYQEVIFSEIETFTRRQKVM